MSIEELIGALIDEQNQAVRQGQEDLILSSDKGDVESGSTQQAKSEGEENEGKQPLELDSEFVPSGEIPDQDSESVPQHSSPDQESEPVPDSESLAPGELPEIPSTVAPSSDTSDIPEHVPQEREVADQPSQEEFSPGDYSDIPTQQPASQELEEVPNAESPTSDSSDVPGDSGFSQDQLDGIEETQFSPGQPEGVEQAEPFAPGDMPEVPYSEFGASEFEAVPQGEQLEEMMRVAAEFHQESFSMPSSEDIPGDNELPVPQFTKESGYYFERIVSRETDKLSDSIKEFMELQLADLSTQVESKVMDAISSQAMMADRRFTL